MAIVIGSLCYIYYGAKHAQPKRTFIQPVLVLILSLWLVAVTGFALSTITLDSLQDQYYPNDDLNKKVEFWVVVGLFFGNFIFVDIWLISNVYLKSALNIDTSFGDYRTQEQRAYEQHLQERRLKTVNRIVIGVILILNFLYSISFYKSDLVIIELGDDHRQWELASRVF